MRKISRFSSILFVILFPLSTSAEIVLPETRNVVGEGEIYKLQDFDAWRSECLKSEDGSDWCRATTTLVDYSAGFELGLSLVPGSGLGMAADVDVDVAPRGWLQLLPFSSSDHYKPFTAAITKIDGQPFDAYWCELTKPKDCFRGPEVGIHDIETLLAASMLTVDIYSETDDLRHLAPVASFEVDLGALSQAFEMSVKFTAEVHGMDPANIDIPREVCTLNFPDSDRRITYSFDEEYDGDQKSIREGLRGPAAGGNCPSYVQLAYLTPNTTEQQRALFCLKYDEQAQIVGFEQGEQDAYGACREPSQTFCERVNESRDVALAITGLPSVVAGGTAATAAATGTGVVMHSSGAAILSGSAGYIAGTLGPLASAVALLTAPATLTAAGISVIAVGGAVYLCHE